MLKIERAHNSEFLHAGQFLLPGPKLEVYDTDTKQTNVVILGKQGVGKTTIFNRLHEYFVQNQQGVTKKVSNRLEFKTGDVNVAVSDIKLPSILNKFCMYSISKGDAFILVYDVSDPESFSYVETLKEYLMDRQSQGVPIIVIGNKTDLPNRSLRYEVVDCVVSIDWEAKYIELSGLKDDFVPKILDILFPKRKQPQFLMIPAGGEFETFEFRGMKFRPRAHTDSKIGKMKKHDVCDVKDVATGGQRLKKRLSLPGLSNILKKSPVLERRGNKNSEKSKRSPSRFRSLSCLNSDEIGDTANIVRDFRGDDQIMELQ